MSRIDWPLAIVLGVVFVVMSVARWRFFMARARRRRGDAEVTAKRDERKMPETGAEWPD